MEELNYAEYLDGVGLMPGDIIDVASDMMSIMMYCRRKKLRFDPNQLLDALKEKVGEEGTVMIRPLRFIGRRGNEERGF